VVSLGGITNSVVLPSRCFVSARAYDALIATTAVARWTPVDTRNATTSPASTHVWSSLSETPH